jgi:hypothetical protein
MSDMYCTTYCNKPHRLSDGKPIAHECYVLPTEALHAEKAGNVSKAVGILGKWKKKRTHRGLKDPNAPSQEEGC